MTANLALYEAMVRSRQRARRVSSRRMRRARRRFDLASFLDALSTGRPSRRSKPKHSKSPKRAKAKQKHQIGTRGYEKVADVGPYVPGFYNVRNVRGRAIVFRRSAALMRRFPSKSRAPCP